MYIIVNIAGLHTCAPTFYTAVCDSLLWVEAAEPWAALGHVHRKAQFVADTHRQM